MEEHYQHLYEALSHVDGYIYPNEIELHWGLMIVLYPYITGLVAGAFILASLERVFNVKVLKPTYVLSLLTALSFLVVATLPLVSHLQHPFRSYEIFMTPNPTSAMAIFGKSVYRMNRGSLVCDHGCNDEKKKKPQLKLVQFVAIEATVTVLCENFSTCLRYVIPNRIVEGKSPSTTEACTLST